MITGKNMTVVPLSEINRMKNMVKDDTDPYKEHLKQDVSFKNYLNLYRETTKTNSAATVQRTGQIQSKH